MIIFHFLIFFKIIFYEDGTSPYTEQKHAGCSHGPFYARTKSASEALPLACGGQVAAVLFWGVFRYLM